jgi:hypothetical protein
MTRAEIVAFAKFIVDTNSRQSSGTFTSADLVAGVQRAYEREWNNAVIQLTRSQVVMSTTFTWQSGAISRAMPYLLRDRIIHSMYDITDNPNGIGLRTVFHIEDMTKLMRWPSTVGTPGTGPFRNTLIRAFFIPQVEVLEEDESVPAYIPSNHHQLLGLSAAIEMVEFANGDKAVASTWRDRLTDLQTTYWQACKVPVLADRARILPDDAVDFFYLGAV